MIYYEHCYYLGYLLSEGLPKSFFRKKNYLILLMTQCMVHCVQFLYKFLIFNPFMTKGVEFLLTFAFKACLVTRLCPWQIWHKNPARAWAGTLASSKKKKNINSNLRGSKQLQKSGTVQNYTKGTYFKIWCK